MQSLRAQTLKESHWELVIVVNEVFRDSPERLPIAVGGRYVVMHEPRPGLIWARLRGLSECRGKWVVLMDDDARLETDYLEMAKRFIRKHPAASVIGGAVQADPAGCRPPRPLERAFALRPVEETRQVGRENFADAPIGVGMVLQREAMAEWGRAVLANPWRQALGRMGTLGGAGEDLDMVATALDAGRDVWICRELKLRHFIPMERLRPLYVRRLVRVNNLGRLNVLYRHGWVGEYPSRRFPRTRLTLLRFLSLWHAMRCDWSRLIPVEREIAALLCLADSGGPQIGHGGGFEP